ncbi:PTS sugar transporter subunit IIC [Staphylococcus haemolyticus]|uniref:PTS sugar transporter subunit IIC n=1 Tax=Staphylococcus haemolyticus TaxID=1283 RepID=UPI0030D62EEC
MGEREMITPRTFIFNVLNGVALAIVVGMIPNAILGELSEYLSQYNDIFTKVAFVTQGIQYSIPILTGVLIAGQFKLTQLQTAVTGAAAFVGSGASTFTDNKWVIVGIGDLINTMITASIAVGIWRVNKPGIPITVLLGAVKLMMPTLIRHPMMMLPIVCTAGVSGFVGGLLNIKGTPDSAGFGLIGLVGPIKSLNLLEMGTTSGLLIIAIVYIIVPLISALFFHYLFVKVLKIYDPNIFKYQV